MLATCDLRHVHALHSSGPGSRARVGLVACNVLEAEVHIAFPLRSGLRDKMISFLAVTLAHSEIEVMHGSGTTNPSKLFWQAMELMTERSKKPLHLTYRAVGSSTGQKEFVGSENNYEPWNNFGSGDIPMTASRYAELTTQGRKMVHVPFALGGIGVFHSVPGTTPIDLTGCLLARIFSRDITDWGHADIKAANPDMTYTGPIKVVHRVQGSSSTAGFTSYLGQKCPDSWDLGSGSTITWPEGTFEAQGSGGMASFIADPENEGAIGYIDAGHGHNAGLSEIELQNKEGNCERAKRVDRPHRKTMAPSPTPILTPYVAHTARPNRPALRTHALNPILPSCAQT